MYSNPPKRRVLVNHLNEPPNRISGITKYTFELLKALVGGAYDYTLVTTWDEAALPAALRGRIKVVTLPYVGSAPLNLLRQTLRMPFVTWRAKAELVFHPTPLGSFLDPWPHVVTAHDLYYETNPEDYPARHVGFWTIAFPRVLAKSRRIIAVSEQTRADLKRFYPSQAAKTVVVHEAGALDASPKKQPFSAPEGKPYGLFVGNLSPNKNAGALVEALRLLAERGIEATIYHAGRDDGGVITRAQGAGAPVRLFSVGSLSDDELAAAYAGAAFFVAPSIREGFCLPVIEAQSYGAPVICSDIPVLREVAGDGALFIDPKAPKTIADAIDRFLSNDQFRNEMSAAARCNAGRFSWAKAARETEAVFAEALET